MGALTLVLGGQKAGKSSAAMRLARASRRPIRLVAPAKAEDAELEERIERHREDREDDITVEETFDLVAALGRAPDDAVVVDAIDTWLLDRMQAAGLLDVGEEPAPLGLAGRAAQASVLAEVDDVARACARRPGPTWIVAGAVGMGMHGATTASRRYEDLHGLATQALGGTADRVLLVVAGRALDLAALDVLAPQADLPEGR